MIQLFGKLISKDPNFYRTVAGIAIPIGLQGLITTGINMMDTIMIGTLGETELSAVSLANQFINIYQILCMGIGMGASVLVSRYYGMKDKVSMQKTVAIMTRFCLVIASVFALLTCLFPGAIMRIYTVEDVIIQNGERYLSWSVVTYFLLGLSLTGTIVLRNVGQVKIPLFTSIGAFFVNILANYMFIFGKLGAPAMGVAGAAIGTLIARIFEFSVIDGFLWFREKSIEFRLKNFFMPVGELWGEYIRISIPVQFRGNGSWKAWKKFRGGQCGHSGNAAAEFRTDPGSFPGRSNHYRAYAGRRRQRESAGTGLCFAGAWFSLWTCLLCDHYDHQRSCHTCLSSFGRDVKTGRGAYGSNQYYRVLSGDKQHYDKRNPSRRRGHEGAYGSG